MYNYQGALVAKGVTFKDNEASLCLLASSEALRIRERSLGAPLASPRTAQYGGAIITKKSLLLVECVFTSNSAGDYVSHPTAPRLPRSPPALRSLAGR